jgi:hypothetical protein
MDETFKASARDLISPTIRPSARGGIQTPYEPGDFGGVIRV